MTEIDFKAILRTLLLSTKPYNQNWEFPHATRTETLHQKLRNMIGISDGEWRDAINKDSQAEWVADDGWKDTLSKGIQ